jgi:hypothetical protein
MLFEQKERVVEMLYTASCEGTEVLLGRHACEWEDNVKMYGI